MEKEQKVYFILLSITAFILGFFIGCVFNEYLVDNFGISSTSYCKEIQVDTIQYDYKQDMYKYQIKLIK